MDIMEYIQSTVSFLTGASVSFIGDHLKNKNQIRIEQLKLHDKPRIEAYRRASLFSRKLTESVFPLATDKTSAFQRIMKKYYFDQNLDMDFVYFNDTINNILQKFESNYTYLINPDTHLSLSPDDPVLDESVFDDAFRLRQEIKEAFFK